MLFAKILGASLIVISGAITSTKFLSTARKDLLRVEALSELVRRICAKIEAFCAPIPEILKDIPKNLFLECEYVSDNLPMTSEELCSFCTFSDDTEIYDLYVSFIRGLGSGYQKEEIKKCNLFLEELNKIIASRRDEFKRKKKVIPAVCISLSISVLILII